MVQNKVTHSKVRLSYTSADDPLIRKILIGGLEFATGRRRIERLYREVKRRNPQGPQLWEALLGQLNVAIEFDRDQLAKAPASGPVIFVCNHPFGVVDGLMLGYLVSRIRPDFAVLVNEVLCREPLFDGHFLPVDFRETRKALHTNLQTRRRAMERLQAGEALAIFPAGGVSTAPQPFGKAQDLEWKRFVAKLVQQTRATVVPVYFHGQNSRVFQIASHVSPQLRLGLLLHEVRNKIGRRLSVNIGDPIPHETIAGIKDRQALLDHLRAATYDLALKD